MHLIYPLHFAERYFLYTHSRCKIVLHIGWSILLQLLYRRKFPRPISTHKNPPYVVVGNLFKSKFAKFIGKIEMVPREKRFKRSQRASRINFLVVLSNF